MTEVTQEDIDIYRKACDAFAQWMGDPEGKDALEPAYHAAGEVIARHRERAFAAAVEQAAGVVERSFSARDDNTDRFLNERICCSGHHCGCMGSSVGDYLEWQLVAAIRQLAPSQGEG